MRHKGNFFEYEEQRNRELMRTYRRGQREQGLKGDALYRWVVEQASIRYWVSEEQAYRVIDKRLRGVKVDYVSPYRQMMYDEIERQVARLDHLRPNASIYDLVFEVVNSPAPKFFLSPESAKVLISKIRTRFYEKRKQALKNKTYGR